MNGNGQYDEYTKRSMLAATFATVVMTGYLWAQVVNGIFPSIV